MHPFSLESFAAQLTTQLPANFTGTFYVGLSGGLDSSVLLHALTQIAASRKGWRIVAVHVDHQLQPLSKEWASKCAIEASRLGVEFRVERVVVTDIEREGLESAARKARYAAFRKLLTEGDVLLTAHHADDQAETVLLALMRGSGVPGLSAMPSLKEFKPGWHGRPLLTHTRAEIENWARSQGIEGIADPANAALRHDRNYLRHEVMPLLRDRWPSIAANIGRSALHLGEASELLEELAQSDLRTCALQRCLRIEALRMLSEPRLRNVLRYWFRERGLTPPSTRKLAGLIHDLFNTSGDRIPTVSWGDAEVHWHRGLLYAAVGAPRLSADERQPQEWERSTTFGLPCDLGSLTLIPTLEKGFSAARLPEILSVSFRKGGEWIQLPHRQHRSALRNLLQEHDVLPWWRDRLPLVYAEKKLIAVGDLFTSDDFSAQPGEAGVRLFWENAPEWKAVTA